MRESESRLRKEIIAIGRKLYRRSLVTARSGNLSGRLNEDTMLITASGTCLGALRPVDIVRAGISGAENFHRYQKNMVRPSSEYPLHRMIYRSFACRRVIHCHPPLANAYFAIYPKLADLVFETRHAIGDVPVVRQNSVTVEDPQPVIKALRKNKLVVLKNHGVVSIGNDFLECFYRIEALESAALVAATARLFNKKILDELDTCLSIKLKKV